MGLIFVAVMLFGWAGLVSDLLKAAGGEHVVWNHYASDLLLIFGGFVGVWISPS